MYFAIENRVSWDSLIFCSPKVKDELQFWHDNACQLNGMKLFDKSHCWPVTLPRPPRREATSGLPRLL